METRASRYSKKNRLKRKIKRNIRKMPKLLLRNLIYLFVGFIYTIFLIIRAFDNLIAKLFMMLPRLMRVSIIYLLIFNFGQDVYDLFKLDKSLNEVVSMANNVNVKAIPTNLENAEEKEEICTLDSTSCKIAENAKKIGLNEEQILISISISKWETGSYTSTAFKKKNNVGGIMCNTGLKSYDTLEDGINHFLNNLKNNYFDIGLNTLELIQPKYCPVGAKNDPNNLNQYWLNGTKKMLKELKEK